MVSVATVGGIQRPPASSTSHLVVQSPQPRDALDLVRKETLVNGAWQPEAALPQLQPHRGALGPSITRVSRRGSALPAALCPGTS